MRPSSSLVAILLFGCGPSPAPVDVAPAAPSSNGGGTGAPPTLDWSALAPGKHTGQACELELAVHTEPRVVPSWPAVVEAFDEKGFTSDLPDDAGARVARICGGGPCQGPLAPLVLAMTGEEAAPAAFRGGAARGLSGGPVRIWGPWFESLQEYHCIPLVETGAKIAGLGADVEHVSLRVAHKRAVGANAEGPCEPGTPGCVRGCAIERVEQFDLFVNAKSGDDLLVTRRLLEAPAENTPQAIEVVIRLALEERRLHVYGCGLDGPVPRAP